MEDIVPSAVIGQAWVEYYQNELCAIRPRVLRLRYHCLQDYHTCKRLADAMETVLEYISKGGRYHEIVEGSSFFSMRVDLLETLNRSHK